MEVVEGMKEGKERGSVEERRKQTEVEVEGRREEWRDG